MLEDRRTLILGTAIASGAACAVWAIAKARRQSQTSGLPTDFESYLVVASENPSLSRRPKPTNYAPTSFEAYLVAPDALDAPDPDPTAAEPEADLPIAPPGSKPVTVLYGTEFGFSREVAEKIVDRLIADSAGTYWPQLLNMASFPSGLPLDQCQALLVACSTQGDGVPPTEARDFCSWLLSAAAPQLAGVHFSVCALGDRAYAHFARCGKTIDARLAALGATKVAPRADIDKEDWKSINKWIDGALEGLSKVQLRTVEDLGGAVAVAAAAAEGGGAALPKWSKSRPYFGEVVAVEGLCTLTDASDKNTGGWWLHTFHLPFLASHNSQAQVAPAK